MILGIDASQANRKIRSGTEWYAWHLIAEFKQLAARGNNLEIRLYTRDELQADLAQDLPASFKIRILRWPLRYFWGQIRLSLEMLFHPPDILFCPAHTIPLVHPKKTFTTLHDVGFMDYPELYDKLSLWYHRWAARLAVRSVIHVFTVSEFSKQRIIENFGDDLKHRISVTYLGITPHPHPQGERNYILYVGRLEPKKNILNIVKAYEMAGTDLQLVLAGRKIDIKDVDEYLSSHPELKPKIRFLGYFDESDKLALYAGAAIFLFPTFYEGFGLPILEAQAAGTPVITSNTASNPEIAGDGAVLVNPDSPYEIAQAISGLLQEENLRQQKIQLGYENVKRFDWTKTAKQTWETLLK